MHLKSIIRNVPDFPKKGIMFRDITSLLENPKAFRFVIGEMARAWRGRADMIVALDARGFIFGAPLAVALSVPLVIARKKGKLPRRTLSVTYDLEYGTDTIEVHADAIPAGKRVLIVDDLLATGGTAVAACSLVLSSGAKVAGCAFVIELHGLGGRAALNGYDLHSLVSYKDGEL